MVWLVAEYPANVCSRTAGEGNGPWAYEAGGRSLAVWTSLRRAGPRVGSLRRNPSAYYLRFEQTGKE